MTLFAGLHDTASGLTLPEPPLSSRDLEIMSDHTIASLALSTPVSDNIGHNHTKHIGTVATCSLFVVCWSAR